ncbi:hypothetical protein LAG73_05905 [Pseudoxanthomonas japonensis]|nr:hypothetical protein LAG73_05905 [Pseudoxanthomonas japonensis]
MNSQRKASLGTLLCLMLLSLWAGAQAQTVRYVHTDALGSVVLMTDASRNVVERNEYEPYGRVLTQPVNDGPGYTGHVQDAATGLTYMQQRYYDPLIGRFLSVDPVTPYSGGIASFNRYWYAGGNPYRFVDPDGRGVWDRIRAAMFPVGTELAQRGEAGTAGSNSIGAAKQIANSMIDAGATMANPAAKLLGVAPPRFQINNNELEGAAGAEFGIAAAGAAAGGIGGVAKSGSTTLFRAVGPAELADIAKLGIFRNLGAAEGKYFTTSARDAAYYAKQAVAAFGDEPYTLIRAQIPNSVLRQIQPVSVDRGVPAYVIPNSQIQQLTKPVMLNQMPVP